MDGITIKEWVWTAPPTIIEALASVPVMNFLREFRGQRFQMQECYDGAMSEECKQIMRREYKALDEFISAIEDR